MVEKGEKVTVQSGMLEGREATVVSVDERQGLATIEVEMFGQTTTKKVMVDDLSVRSRDPEAVLAEVGEKVRSMLRSPVDTRQTYWWARRAFGGFEPGADLLEEYRSFAEDLEEEYRASVAEQLDALKEAVDTEDADAIRARFSRLRDQLESRVSEETREATEQLCHELFSVDEIEAAKQQALDDPERVDLLSDEEVGGRAMTELLEDVSEQGFDLWRASQKEAARASGVDYAYDEISAGPVDLDFPAPKDEVPDEQRLEEMEGPTSVEAQMEVDEAIEVLDEAETAPLAALRTLAADQPDEAVDALKAKRRELLQNAEGGAERFEFINEIDATLLCFDRDAIWRSVITGRVGLEGEVDAVDALRGLVTRDRLVEPFGDNAWGIKEEPGLDEIIDRIWEPLAQRLPNGLAEFRRRVIAVGLIGEGDEQRLLYLTIQPYDPERLRERGAQRGYPGSFDTEALAAWIGFGTPTVVAGTVPDETVTVELEDEGGSFQLPMALRELRSRHGRLTGRGVDVGGVFRTLGRECGHDEARFGQANDGATPERFVAFGNDPAGNAFVFDRDELDTRRDPKAATWNRQSWKVGERQAFWSVMDVVIRHIVGVNLQR